MAGGGYVCDIVAFLQSILWNRGSVSEDVAALRDGERLAKSGDALPVRAKVCFVWLCIAGIHWSCCVRHAGIFLACSRSYLVRRT